MVAERSAFRSFAVNAATLVGMVAFAAVVLVGVDEALETAGGWGLPEPVRAAANAVFFWIVAPALAFALFGVLPFVTARDAAKRSTPLSRLIRNAAIALVAIGLVFAWHQGRSCLEFDPVKGGCFEWQKWYVPTAERVEAFLSVIAILSVPVAAGLWWGRRKGSGDSAHA